jgi:hypothetical protein
VGELLIAIQIYIDAHNADPKPFVWTASAETMLGDPEPSPDMPPGTVPHLRAPGGRTRGVTPLVVTAISSSVALKRLQGPS